MAFTRIPSGPSSCDIVRVRVISAALLALYAPVSGSGRIPATDAMLMTLPPFSRIHAATA